MNALSTSAMMIMRQSTLYLSRPGLSNDGMPELSASKHLSTQPAERCHFSFQSVDLFPHRRRQRRGRCIPTELAEDVLEVQFSLGGDLPTSPFLVEFGDELAGCCHPSSIGQFALDFDPASFVTPPPSTPWLP